MQQQGRKAILRWVLVGTVLCVAVGPTVPLVGLALGHESSRPLWTVAFSKSLQSTLWLGFGVSVVSLLIGFPLGLLATLYRFPARRSLVLFQVLPLLLPSFLPCIGWSNLAAEKWLSWPPMPDRFAGCLFVLSLQTVPPPFFATWAACKNLTASQVDAARLHGGERSVLELSARACAPVAILAALLGGILSFSDTGAPLIFGCRSVAVEILTSFSALYDYDLAGRQCFVLAGFVLLLTAPLLIVGLRRPALACHGTARTANPARNSLPTSRLELGHAGRTATVDRRWRWYSDIWTGPAGHAESDARSGCPEDRRHRNDGA